MERAAVDENWSNIMKKGIQKTIMERLHILGTGNAMVTECFNTCFVLEDNERYLLVDTGGGNGILARLKEAGIGIHQLGHIFISHNHIDHILGAIWLIRAYGAYVTGKPEHMNLKIYAHKGVVDIVNNMIDMLLNKKQSKSLEGKLEFVEIGDGRQVDIFDWHLRFFDILSTKDKQFGFNMKLASGKKLVFLGDEPYRDAFESFSTQADYMLHEAFCLYSDRESFKPYAKHHCTVKDACENGEKLKVKNLIIYHTEDKNYRQRKDLYKSEGQAYYKGNLFVPYDLEVIDLV